MFNTIKAILAVATLLFSIGMLGACGGGGNSAAPATPSQPPVVTPQYSYTVRYASVAFLPDVANQLFTVTLSLGYRNLYRNDGVSIGTFTLVTVISPGGSGRLATTPSQIGIRQFTLPNSWQGINGATVGATVVETAYIADFSNRNCDSVSFSAEDGTASRARHYAFTCLNAMNVAIASVTVYKTERQTYQVCYRNNGNRVFCDLEWNHDDDAFVALAFPRQTYRRDDGECESAPFYAVGNCQSENAVDVGNFAAFVSGLDGNGYRQFGVRHRWKAEDWNAAAMVSHAKGGEFLDTWWGRLRFEHSVFGDAAAFAEYESGITSLRQNGLLFADIPISGGRIGFRLDDFTASFGRPMHYQGKGKNAAAIHWQATKQTGFSFRRHNDNAEVQWQWRRRF